MIPSVHLTIIVKLMDVSVITKVHREEKGGTMELY